MFIFALSHILNAAGNAFRPIPIHFAWFSPPPFPNFDFCYPPRCASLSCGPILTRSPIAPSAAWLTQPWPHLQSDSLSHGPTCKLTHQAMALPTAWLTHPWPHTGSLTHGPTRNLTHSPMDPYWLTHPWHDFSQHLVSIFIIVQFASHL